MRYMGKAPGTECRIEDENPPSSDFGAASGVSLSCLWWAKWLLIAVLSAENAKNAEIFSTGV